MQTIRIEGQQTITLDPPCDEVEILAVGAPTVAPGPVLHVVADEPNVDTLSVAELALAVAKAFDDHDETLDCGECYAADEPGSRALLATARAAARRLVELADAAPKPNETGVGRYQRLARQEPDTLVVFGTALPRVEDGFYLGELTPTTWGEAVRVEVDADTGIRTALFSADNAARLCDVLATVGGCPRVHTIHHDGHELHFVIRAYPKCIG